MDLEQLFAEYGINAPSFRVAQKDQRNNSNLSQHRRSSNDAASLDSASFNTARNNLHGVINDENSGQAARVSGNISEQVAPVEGRPHNQVQQDTSNNSPEEIAHPALSFAAVVSGDMRGAIPLRQRTLPRIVGGKVAISISEDEYARSITQFRCCLIGRLILMKGDKPIMSKDLKAKLSAEWRIALDSWQLIPMGRGFYTLNLKSDEVKSRVFSRGTLFLKPGVFRISQWSQNFNPNLQRQTNSQVWVRFFDLPMEYWDPIFLMDIAGGIGEPLRIDERTLRKEFGSFARVLVDMDFTRPLPEEILVQRERFEFFIYAEYEKLPSFCTHCVTVGHDVSQCKHLHSSDEVSALNRMQRGDADKRRLDTAEGRGRQLNQRDSNAAGKETEVRENSHIDNNVGNQSDNLSSEDEDSNNDEGVEIAQAEPGLEVPSHVSETQCMEGDEQSLRVDVVHTIPLENTIEVAPQRRQSLTPRTPVRQPQRDDEVGLKDGEQFLQDNSNNLGDRLSASLPANSLQVDEDGFQRVYTKTQLRNWRKKNRREEQRLERTPYSLRSRANSTGNL